jgi:hypothetical protein
MTYRKSQKKSQEITQKIEVTRGCPILLKSQNGFLHQILYQIVADLIL